jgi:hypothetical protein
LVPGYNFCIGDDMKNKIFQIIAVVLVAVTSMACQKAKVDEGWIPVSEHDVWNQDTVREIYEGGWPVPTFDIFNCRRDITENSQRYFRLKINTNRIERFVSADGIDTTVYRFAQLKHLIKNIISSREVTYTDFVFAAVDVTVEILPATTRITLVLSPERPNDHQFIYVPEGSELSQIHAGDELARFFVEDAAKKEITFETNFHELGTSEDPLLECEFVQM